MKIQQNITHSEIEICNINDLQALLDLQDDFFKNAQNTDILRENSQEMFIECLKYPNITFCYRINSKIEAFAVLYANIEPSEDLSKILIDVPFSTENIKCANYKLCIVSPLAQGNGLQQIFGEIIEKYAKKSNIELLCATVSPENHHSRNNMLKLGYEKNMTCEKYGLIRDVFYKLLV